MNDLVRVLLDAVNMFFGWVIELFNVFLCVWFNCGFGWLLNVLSGLFQCALAVS